MTRHTTFCFTLKPTPSQAEALARHVGAARFAFNQCLAFVRDALASKSDEGPSPFVPWSGFDLINAFNRWKTTAAAGADESGAPGLPWRTHVRQQVFEEAAVDLGSALAAFSAERKRERKGWQVLSTRCSPTRRLRERRSEASNSNMSDERAPAQEIPVEEDDLQHEPVASNRDARRRVTPPVGAALSVLWWPDVERGSSR